MREDRRAARSAVRYQGKVVLAGRPDIDCVIRDVSATGARLQFRVRAFLPRTFHLRFNGQDREARVVWQSGLFAGVRFTEPLTMQKSQQKKRSLWGALMRA